MHTDSVLSMETPTHVFFYGHKPNSLGVHIFSQFYQCSFTDPETRKTYTSAEQWMMEHKALHFGDHEVAAQIMTCTDPAQIKALGRKVRGFDDAKWDTVKFKIVVKGNTLKFSQNSGFKTRLASTGDKIIVEASPHDKVWGIGLSKEDAIKTNPSDWPGQNLLGLALMEVRDSLQDSLQD